MVAATHALVFAVIYYFTHRMVWMNLEGFAAVSKTASGRVIAPTFTGRPTGAAVANTVCKDTSGRVIGKYDAKGNCVATTITSGR